MGRRASYETVARIVVAFLEHRTIAQADLARRVEVDTRTIRKHLRELSAAGVPLEREEEHPHVYWSVPRNWVPGGTLLPHDQLSEIARLVARHPKTDARERLLDTLLRGDPGNHLAVPPNAADLEAIEHVLATLEDAAAAGLALRTRYFTSSRGDRDDRHLSVHHIDYAPPVRFVATCHRDHHLKWFRADRIEQPRLDPDEPYRPTTRPDVDRFIAESFRGYRGPGIAQPLAFTIRWPEGRWAVRAALPPNATVEYQDTHARIVVHTGALDAIARVLVGLGDLVHAESPALRARIVELARGALQANDDPAKVNESSVGPKRMTK